MMSTLFGKTKKLAALVLFVWAALAAWAEYWEAPSLLGQDARFPSLFSTRLGPLAVWQESSLSGENGKATIHFARFMNGGWQAALVSDASYSFTSTGAPPILFSAAQAPDGGIAIAIAATRSRIEIWLSQDGGSFKNTGTLESSDTSVAPRIYPRTGGGWLLFVTQGRATSVMQAPGASPLPATATSAANSGTAPAAAGSASSTESQVLNGQPSSLGIYVAHSADGAVWSSFSSLTGDSEGLPMNFAPVASRQGGRDIVVFQTYILGEGEQPSRYELMEKISTDGGASWSPAKALSEFGSEPKSYDNQGPQLLQSGGHLYIAWERRRLKSTQTQVWAARLDEAFAIDPKSAAPVLQIPGSFFLAQLFDQDGSPAVVLREDKLKANRVFFASFKSGSWTSEDSELADRVELGQSGQVSFAKAAFFRARSFVVWQLDTGSTTRLYAMAPVTSVGKAGLGAQNFTPQKRTRAETALVRIQMPQDAAGIKGYAYIWKKISPETKFEVSGEETEEKLGRQGQPSLAELWKSGEKGQASELDLSLAAPEDGLWQLYLSVEDNAGNRSEISQISFIRKRRAPPAPIVLMPDLDERGFVTTNSFTVRWVGPEGEDLAGYTWDFAYAGALAEASAKNPADVPAYESRLMQNASLRTPPPTIRGTGTSYAVDNIDNGYYLFSVSAIDDVGNISGTATVLLRTDKFKPYTLVTLTEGSRDDLGRNIMKILGRGFLADGRIERIAVSRTGREPYDFDKSLGSGDFSIVSDREIDGLSLEGAEAGIYRLGLYHSGRGWYWTAPIVAIDASGTVKYGLNVEYKPSLAFLSGAVKNFTLYDAIILMALLFAATGILLVSRRAMAVVREGELVRQEALALITGGSMPTAERAKETRKLGKKGAGLRTKFTLTIAFLVILVVLLLAGALGYNMIRRTGEDLAKGLDQRSRVLLESAAQGGRFFLGKEDAITQLSFLPSQTKAMDGASYITISGLGSDPKTVASDVVYATNDPKIVSKLDPGSLGPESTLVLGQSSFAAKGGKDPLAPLVGGKAGELEGKARAAIADELTLKQRLAQEKASLKAGKAGDERKAEINAELDQSDVRIREKLRVLSDREVGTLPFFNTESFGPLKEAYLYYKPILEYRPSDSILFRGLVRLEVSTTQISVEVRQATFELVRLTLIIAAIALGLGIVGAFILSSAIVRPIKTLVGQIANIRDTDDKESLEGSKIEVRSRDELFTLAETVNQMTEGLVNAAKAAKELTVGKGIQKMFIPLDPASGSRAKLSTGRRDEKDFEIYGYYEGAKGVSGDYWDFQSINARYHYFIKCDISGKGVSAALIMVQVATMVITFFNEWKKAMPKAIDLTTLAYRINDFLEERQFVGRFAAFTVGVWDSQEGIAYLCEAGDRKLHVWDEAKCCLVEELLPDSPAAGPLASFMVQMKNPFTQIVRKLGHGDALMLYTDGIEEAKRHFRDADYRIIECTDAPKDQPHHNHSGGQDNEEFGYDRITAVLEALARKGRYKLEKEHNPAPSEVLSFDFSTTTGSLEEKVLALIAVEKVFRMYRDPGTTDKDAIVIDEKIDDFLARHFDQYRLYYSNLGVYVDSSKENPGYRVYKGIKEDSQYDDLTVLAIRRK